MKIITLLILILSVVCGCKKENNSITLILNSDEEELLNYITSNDEGYEEMVNNMKDFDIRSILSDKENNF